MILLILCLACAASSVQGTSIGSWVGQSSPTAAHGITGTVSFKDNKTILLENFNYDGLGIQVILYYYPVGGPQTGRNGIAINTPAGSTVEFPNAATDETVTGVMPSGKTVCDIQTLTIWCSTADVIFAQIVVNRDDVFANDDGNNCIIRESGSPPPTGTSIGSWMGQSSPTAAHGITGTVTFKDNRTMLLENFNYDGLGIAVILYYYPVGGPQTGRNGIAVNTPAGSTVDFPNALTNAEVTGVMPSGKTVCDIQTLTIWCSTADVIFAQIVINRNDVFANDDRNNCVLKESSSSTPSNTNRPPSVYPNCIPFSQQLQVSWSVDKDNGEVDFLMCGCRSTQMVNQYMAFGLSGRSDSTFMVGADATVAWVDVTSGEPNAVDYYITGRFQCRGGAGVCPDTLISGSTCSNDVREGSVTGGFRNSGMQCVAFSRPFVTSDSSCDTKFNVSNENQFIVWALGGLGETAFIHFERSDPDSAAIHLGREPMNQCSSSSITCSACPVFENAMMSLPNDATLRAYIGPSGQERGYMGITGRAGWGIAWYINGTLIPTLEVQRGRTYTFIIEGGTDEQNLAQFHPFYITDSIGGGRIRNEAAERNDERVFAGFDGDEATGIGRLCERQESQEARRIRETCGPYSAYEEALSRSSLPCAPGQPGVLRWTPDENTPDTVFYQCATHRNLGWKILVRDEIQGVSGGMKTAGHASILSIFGVFLFVLSSFMFL